MCGEAILHLSCFVCTWPAKAGMCAPVLAYAWELLEIPHSVMIRHGGGREGGRESGG